MIMAPTTFVTQLSIGEASSSASKKRPPSMGERATNISRKPSPQSTNPSKCPKDNVASMGAHGNRRTFRLGMLPVGACPAAGETFRSVRVALDPRNATITSPFR